MTRLLSGRTLQLYSRIAGFQIEAEEMNTAKKIYDDVGIGKEQAFKILKALEKSKHIIKIVNKENRRKSFYGVNEDSLLESLEEYQKARYGNIFKHGNEKYDFIPKKKFKTASIYDFSLGDITDLKRIVLYIHQRAFLLNKIHCIKFETESEMFSDLFIHDLKRVMKLSGKNRPFKLGRYFVLSEDLRKQGISELELKIKKGVVVID